MADPLTVTIEHHSTKDAVTARLKSSMGQIRAQLAPYVTALDEEWGEDRVEFRLIAIGQTVTGVIEIDDTVVRAIVRLPGVLAFLGGKIAPLVRQHGIKLLTKPWRS